MDEILAERQVKPKVTIVILNWNGAKDTLALLENLQEVTYPNFSVLIVDNASTDDSLGQFAHYIEQQRKTDHKLAISLLPLSQNFGYAEGNNKGIAQASRETVDYYLLLNNDTLVDPHFLTELVEIAELNPDLASICPTIYFASSKGTKHDQLWYAGGWMNFFAGGAHHKVKPAGHLSRVRPTEFLTGCCLLLRTQALAKLEHLFDPAFFTYGEDVDLSLRLRKTGFSLAFAPQSKVWHKLATSSGGPKSYNFWYYNVRNNFLIMARYGSWYHWPVFILYFLFYKPVLWSIAGAILKPRRDKWYRLLAIAHGTIDALLGRYGRRAS